MDKAVSATLEMESYLVSPKASHVAQVEVEAEAPEQSLVAACSPIPAGDHDGHDEDNDGPVG